MAEPVAGWKIYYNAHRPWYKLQNTDGEGHKKFDGQADWEEKNGNPWKAGKSTIEGRILKRPDKRKATEPADPKEAAHPKKKVLPSRAADPKQPVDPKDPADKEEPSEAEPVMDGCRLTPMI